MKFFLFLIPIILLGAGCASAKTDSYSVQPATPVTVSEEPSSLTSRVMEATQRHLNGQKDLAKEYTKAVIKTNKGDITVELYGDESPITVNNFLNLAEQGYYDGTKFHRVIKDFMVQAGDPESKGTNTALYGTGGPEYRFPDEINNKKLVVGSLAMANAGPNTNGSQFFIVTAKETPWLDGKHTNFGMVTGGLDVVKAIENAETDMRDLPIAPIIIEHIELVK